MLTVGSLFSGIGGIDLGLERAGMKVLWQVEIDPWCRAVLAKHWPKVDRYDDVREVHGAGACFVGDCRLCLRPVDLIAGGFPCQDISHAGKRGGITAARSGLWSEFARLIRDLRPRYVLVENVADLRIRGLDVVLADLSSSRYDAEWDCIPAAAVGAPHLRDRIWLVATRSEQRWPLADSDLRRSRDSVQAGRDAPWDGCTDVADAYSGRRGIDGESNSGTEQPQVEASQRDDADGLHSDVADPDKQGLERWLLQPKCAGELAAGAGGVEDADRSPVESRRGRGRASQAGELPDADGLAAGRSAIAWDERDPWRAEPAVGRVADGIPGRVDRLRGLGNAVVPQVVEWIGRRIVEAEEEMNISQKAHYTTGPK